MLPAMFIDRWNGFLKLKKAQALLGFKVFGADYSISIDMRNADGYLSFGGI